MLQCLYGMRNPLHCLIDVCMENGLGIQKAFGLDIKEKWRESLLCIFCHKWSCPEPMDTNIGWLSNRLPGESVDCIFDVEARLFLMIDSNIVTATTPSR